MAGKINLPKIKNNGLLGLRKLCFFLKYFLLALFSTKTARKMYTFKVEFQKTLDLFYFILIIKNIFKISSLVISLEILPYNSDQHPKKLIYLNNCRFKCK